MKSGPVEIKQWTTNQVILATLFVVCVFLSFWLLFRFRAVIFLVFIAVVIGTTMRPAVEWFYRRGLSRAAGIIIIYALIAAILIGILALVVPLVVNQATQLSQNLPEYQTALRKALIDSNNLLLRNIGVRIPAQFHFLRNRNPTSKEVFDQVGQTIYYAKQAVKGLLSILAVFLLAYYWTQESNFVIRDLLRLIPRPRRKSIRDFIRLVEVKISGYIRGQAILSSAVGLAAFIAYALIGLPYTLVLAIIAGILEMVPTVGPALGAIPALLVALTIDPERALWVIVATVMIQTLESIFLVPRIMNDSMGVNPIITLLSLITFSSVFGFLGALLAMPLAAIIQLLFERIVFTANGSVQDLRPDEISIQSLIGRGQATARLIVEASHTQGTSLYEEPEHVRMEMSAIARDLADLISSLKSDEEV
jgi:predicted PurR-regulated permease PerM